MNDEEEEFYEEEEFQEHDADALAIMETYRRQKIIEHLVGPFISTVTHIIMLFILAIFLVFPAKEEKIEVQVQMEEVKIKEIEKEVLEELEEETEEEEEAPDVQSLDTSEVETDSPDSSLEEVNDDMPSTDDNMDMDVALDVTATLTPLTMPGLYGGRSAGGRKGALRRNGGSSKGEKKVMNALSWLRDHQNFDGSWGSDSHPVAISGLALLTFLAHGETPSSPKFGKCVKKAIRWLVDRSLNTKDGKPMPTRNMAYAHGIGTYALSEAYAMTGISEVRTAMDRAISVLIKGQQSGGGFGYGYKLTGKYDISVVGWNTQALKAAYVAGSEVEGLYAAIQKVTNLFKNDSVVSLPKNPGFVYQKVYGSAGKAVTRASLRAIGTLCLQLLGEGEIEHVKKCTTAIMGTDLKHLNWETKSNWPFYTWYYATQAIFHKGGPDWKIYNKQFKKVLINTQFDDGHWESPAQGEMTHMGSLLDGQVYSTTLAALMLTVYYRYLPSYKLPKPSERAKKKAKEAEGEGGVIIE